MKPETPLQFPRDRSIIRLHIYWDAPLFDLLNFLHYYHKDCSQFFDVNLFDYFVEPLIIFGHPCRSNGSAATYLEAVAHSPFVEVESFDDLCIYVSLPDFKCDF